MAKIGVNLNQTAMLSEETHKDVEAGKKRAVADLNYRYNFVVNKRKMAEFIKTAKLANSTASKELNGFIDRFLSHHGVDL